MLINIDWIISYQWKNKTKLIRQIIFYILGITMIYIAIIITIIMDIDFLYFQVCFEEELTWDIEQKVNKRYSISL